MIKFTDVRPEYNGSTSHASPNECLVTLRSLLDDLPPLMAQGGSIASGGEVPLTVVLPRVEQLKIVDHNYGSLWWTCNKILMIKHLTNEQIVALFKGPQADFTKFLNDLKADNPLSGKYYTDTSKNVANTYWLREITPRDLDIARERLDQIDVIHGDLRDLGTKIDLLYVSNALEHCPFDGPAINGLTQTVKSVVGYRGHIIGTNVKPEGCHLNQSVNEKCPYSIGHLSWTYFRMQPKIEPHRYEPHVAKRVLQMSRFDPYYRRELQSPVNLQLLYKQAFTYHMQQRREQQQRRIEAIR